MAVSECLYRGKVLREPRKKRKKEKDRRKKEKDRRKEKKENPARAHSNVDRFANGIFPRRGE